MDWDSTISGFISFLTLEKGLSGNSIEAYERDVRRMALYIARELKISSPTKVETVHIEKFLHLLHDLEISSRSQARNLSAIRSFFQYLILEDIITADPTELVNGPKAERYLPEVLTYEEIRQMIDSIDLSHREWSRGTADSR